MRISFVKNNMCKYVKFQFSELNKFKVGGGLV